MIAALLYLQSRSFANRMRVRFARLKKPKYLAGAIVGGLYFYWYFFRFLFGGGRRAAVTVFSTEQLGVIESLAALALLVIVVLAWIIPHGRAALAFTEAEVAFLFPAPISRRGLIHYKLVRSQVAILFTTLFLTLITGRFGSGGSAWIHAAGWWVILSTLNLHFLGSSFARAWLFEHGVANWQRRLGVLAGLLVVGGVIAIWSHQTLRAPQPEDFAGLDALKAYAGETFGSGPAPWLLWPFRFVVRPFLAANGAGFLHAFWPALALLALHYIWVVRANVSFEEASVELSRRTAERIAAARAGNFQGSAKKRKRPPFELNPVGSPAVALLWKNLIATGNVFTLRTFILIGAVTVPALVLMAGPGSRTDLFSAVGFAAVMVTAWSLFLGPQILRQDFRQDLPVADILKAYPMRGWQVVLGELLAPAVVLACVQWLLLAAAVALISRVPGEAQAIPLFTRLAIGFGAALVLPMLNLVSLLIPNASVLLFPTWVQVGREGPQGIEATGQRLIFMLGQLLVFMVAVVPAAVAFAVVYVPLMFLAGPIAVVPVAAVAAALTLAVEAGLGVMWLGRLFERFDLSAEAAG